MLVHPRDTPAEPWQQVATELFHRRMLDSETPFPCIFGVDAIRKGTLRYSYIPAGLDRAEVLAAALREFTSVAPSLGNRTSLVCFFDTEDELETIEDYRRHFWSLLNQLHATDVSEWPEGISEDPRESTWEFSYNSTPLFVVANTPCHERRRSRFSEYFVVTFQPRFVFDDLKAGTRTGDQARTVIRRRLRNYDQVEQTPLLGSFGDPGNLEWAQYFLADDNQSMSAAQSCPITSVRRSLIADITD